MSAAVARRSSGLGVRSAVVKVKIAIKDLGIDDDTYRAMLSRITGHASATLCSDAQLGVVLDELKAKGWKPKAGPRSASKSTRRPRQAQHPLALKARAMWISLHQLGEVRDPSEAALQAFARRLLGVDRLEWVKPDHGSALIEALKAMAERAGWSQDTTGLASADRVPVLKARLATLISEREASQ